MVGGVELVRVELAVPVGVVLNEDLVDVVLEHLVVEVRVPAS